MYCQQGLKKKVLMLAEIQTVECLGTSFHKFSDFNFILI